MRMKLLLPCLAALVIVVFACKDRTGKGDEAPDRYNRGTIHISCDESFKPVIDEEVKVYESQFPDTRIIVHYKPEAECLKDFLVDSIKLVIATRGFSKAERQLIIDSLQIEPDQLVIARDLIAVMVNRSAKDSFFSMAEIKALLAGKTKENLIPVFDGTKATSTVRFMLDSVLKGDSLSARSVAANSSREVIDYVSKVPNAVGFIGFSWIGNSDDSAQEALRSKIRIARLESTDSANAYVLPSQFFIYTRSYPLVRDLVYVVKEKHQGLAHAFAHFLATDRGQLIFRRAYIMPVLRPNYIRDARLNEQQPVKINNQ